RSDFLRAAELAPNDAEPLLALGDLQRDLGEYTTAVETYRSAIAREDADAASWLKLGNSLALLERYLEASRAFRAAIRRAPDLAAAHNGLGASLMHLGRTDEAILALDRAATLDACDPNPLLNLALLHQRSGEEAAAREAGARALERDPESETGPLPPRTSVRLPRARVDVLHRADELVAHLFTRALGPDLHARVEHGEELIADPVGEDGLEVFERRPAERPIAAGQRDERESQRLGVVGEAQQR